MNVITSNLFFHRLQWRYPIDPLQSYKQRDGHYEKAYHKVRWNGCIERKNCYSPLYNSLFLGKMYIEKVKAGGFVNQFIEKIPSQFQNDVQKAIRILKESGCNEIYLFGSLVGNRQTENSDIDLAIRGCNPEDYFKLLGKLMLELEHPVDLINLDRNDKLTKYLEKEGDMVSVQ